MYKNLCAAALAAVLFPFVCQPSAGFAQSRPPLKVGFVYVSPVAPTGWTRQHDQGRQAMVKALGDSVQTTVVENVQEGPDAERVIRDLAQRGHQLIVTPSFGFMEPTLRVAKEFPNVRFESVTGFKTATNVATANARYYEGRYLAGVAAASVSAHLGYLAGFPIPEVLQGINAFALGARSVNPAATVRVVWLNEWFNPPKEREAANSLLDQGVEVLAFHTASSAPMMAAQERSKWAIGYHSDMSGVGPTAQLLAVTHHWGAFYTARAKAVQNANWAVQQVWGGLSTGMVDVGHFGPRLSEAGRAQVLAHKKRIVNGRLKPFAAGRVAVRDNEGREVIAAGGALTDAQLMGMNWLVEGVVGRVK